MEKSHGNWSKPPRSRTMVGTAVDRIVESIALRNVDSMRARRTGPRSARSPTSFAIHVVNRIRACLHSRPRGLRRGSDVRGGCQNARMLLADVVATTAQVATTASRLAKTDALAALLSGLDADEIPIAIG